MLCDDDDFNQLFCFVLVPDDRSPQTPIFRKTERLREQLRETTGELTVNIILNHRIMIQAFAWLTNQT